MTSIAPQTEHDDEETKGQSSRHGQRWTEEDFAGIMQACRDGCSPEQIAARVGRTEHGLRSQLRRMLPAEERHLSADLVVPRLRQLDRNGDYDWLASMAQRSISPWERQAAAEAERDARGFGALSDDELLGLAHAIVHSAVETPAAITRPISVEISRRELESQVRWSASSTADAAADRLLRRTTPWWSDGAPYA